MEHSIDSHPICFENVIFVDFGVDASVTINAYVDVQSIHLQHRFIVILTMN